MLKVERGFLYIDNGAALKKECQKDWLRQHRLQVQMGRPLDHISCSSPSPWPYLQRFFRPNAL